jgi:prostaglandin-endoperoxide synthase 2
VAALFKRPDGRQRLSDKSTCLFPAFAQYLTDGFIRTDPNRRDRTTSNHEIDLCPLYGRTEAQTDALRLRDETPERRGRLKSQSIGGEEYPPYLHLPDGSAIDPAFQALDPPLMGAKGGEAGAADLPREQLASLFAVGGDRANSTPFVAMMNALFLREHNRIAGELEKNNPAWDDERVFQTARNIVIVVFIKIVVEQYINHITPMPFNLVADPSVAWAANWNRPNWITAEFSLLYRWHALVPDVIDWPGGPIPLAAFGLDNRPLVRVGLAAAFEAAAAQPAAALGALNTSEALTPVEYLAVEQARLNRLQPYNAYRVRYGLPPARAFSDITGDARIEAALRSLYATPDEVELYPGLFAEDCVDKSPLPGLMLRMVGVDAFSQALTNPLLSEHVFNAETFTTWGFALIQETHSLGQILQRQGAATDPKRITMTQPTWSHGWHLP